MRIARAALVALALTVAAAPDGTFADAPLPVSDIVVDGRPVQGGWLRGTVPAQTASLLMDGKPVPFAVDHTFFVAFDRDAPPQVVLTAKRADSVTGKPLADVSLTIAIAARSWDIQNVNVAKRPGGLPDAEFQRRRKDELLQIGAARALDKGAQGWRQQMLRPAAGRISGHFGSQRIYRGEPGAYHSGMDIAGGSGAPYVSPADGVVVLAAQEPFTLEGHLLLIDHGMGLCSAFLHASQLDVKVGDVVRRGQVLGRIGMTGRATGPHLHWSLTWKGRRLDPELFLPSAP